MKIFKNYLFSLANILTNFLFPLITFPYASRILGPDGLGEVQFVFSIAYYFSIVAGLGIPTYGVTALSQCESDSEKKRIIGELLLINFLASVVMSAAFLGLVFWSNLIQIDAFQALAGITLIFSCFMFVDWYFQANNEFKSLAIRSIIVKIIFVVLLYSLLPGHSDKLIYLFLLVFVFVGKFIWDFIILLRRKTITFKNLKAKKHIPHLIFIVSTMAVTMIYSTFDVLILKYFTDYSEVGNYTSAIKIARLAVPFLTTFGLVLLPQISKGFASENNLPEHQLSWSFEFIAFVSIPTSFTLLIFHKELILLFSGIQFTGAFMPLAILSFIPVLVGYGHLFNFQILIPMNKSRYSSITSLIGSSFFLISGIFLIPKYGAVGTSISILITEFIVTTTSLAFCDKEIRKILPYSALTKAFISSLIFIPIHQLIVLLEIHAIWLFLLSIILFITFYMGIQLLLFKNFLLVKLIELSKQTLLKKQ